ncbi:MAG: acyltransferase [Lachnospiraceae bacterium]|nr:acyltransferase [Lachnospiraceae bacterium]
MNSKRIDCIEGLRTIGWIGVFLCHFRGAFFPNATIWMDSTPLRFIYSGNAYVRLLFVISGFVISYKYFLKDKYDDALQDICKRYFRLMPPILAAELFVFVLMNVGALRNAEVATMIGSENFLGIFNQFTPNIGTCLKEALFSTYFNGANAYIGPLWTMIYEYLGAIFVIAAVSILKKSNWRWIFYGVFLYANSNYYNYFVIGMLICDLYANFDIPLKIKERKLSIIIALVGYTMLSMVNLNDSDKYSRIVFGIGIILFMLGVLSSDFLNKILGNKLMVKGGELAYSAYIIHWPIVETISCGLLLLFYDEVNYKLLVSIICIISFIFIVIFAYLMKKYVEPLGLYISRNLKLMK